jgi:stage III sporulation protein AA
VGKTTLLRNVALELSKAREPKRVALIDTRYELSYSVGTGGLIDILSGYPRALGIEIAVRCMNPQVIICDEIGEKNEAYAIASAKNSGVPFVASAHGESIEGLLQREGINLLHEAGVFGFYVGIKRSVTGGNYEYLVTSKEAVDDWLQNNGRCDIRHMWNSCIVKA